jgi:hypothetical protein
MFHKAFLILFLLTVTFHFTVFAQQREVSFFTMYMDASRSNELKDSIFLEKLSKVVNPELVSKLPIIDWAAHARYTIKNIDNQYFAMRDCSYDVLKWKKSNWEIINESHNVGHNCDGNFMVINDTLFSIGNYGYWRKHSNIEYYDSTKKGWNITKTKNQPIDYGSSYVYLKGDTLVSLFGLFHNASYDLFKPYDSAYYFIKSSREWIEVPIQIKKEYLASNNMKYSYGFELKDYYIIFYNLNTDLGFLVFNKNTNRIFDFKNAGHFFEKSSFQLIIDNTMYFQTNTSLEMIDFEAATSSYIEIGHLEFSNTPIKSKWYKWLWLLLIIPIGFAIFLLNNRKREILRDDIDSLIKELLKLQGQTLKVDELDKFLGIANDCSPEVMRAHRAKLIKDINQRHELMYKSLLIHRIKDKNDKRYVLYQIGNEKNLKRNTFFM